MRFFAAQRCTKRAKPGILPARRLSFNHHRPYVTSCRWWQGRILIWAAALPRSLTGLDADAPEADDKNLHGDELFHAERRSKRMLW